MNEIWLQVKDGDGEENDDVTWNKEKVFDTDIRYIKDKRHRCEK